MLELHGTDKRVVEFLVDATWTQRKDSNDHNF